MSRTADPRVAPELVARWSPRAFGPDPLDADTLAVLFDAARWAPSAYNAQPWRFVWALRDDANWSALLDLLLPFNAGWASSASALVYVLSARTITPPGAVEPSPAFTASFDAGAAWALLALQAHRLGLVTHAMAGFDNARAPAVLGAGEAFKVEAAVAIGWPGDPAGLSEALQARETPSPRHSVSSFAYPGQLPSR